MTVALIDVIKIVFCFILPPVAVGLEKGWCSTSFWLNVILTILGWLPGQVHACCVVLLDDDKLRTEQTTVVTEQPATVVQPVAGDPMPATGAQPFAGNPMPATAAQPFAGNPMPATAAPAEETVIVVTEEKKDVQKDIRSGDSKWQTT